MKIGFSGSRQGMNPFQKHWLNQLLLKFIPTKFYHGACVGADEEAAILCKTLDAKALVIAYPPTTTVFLSEQALHWSQIIEPPQGYLARNDAIVKMCDILIATPAPDSKGTRYTIDKALKSGRTAFVIEQQNLKILKFNQVFTGGLGHLSK